MVRGSIAHTSGGDAKLASPDSEPEEGGLALLCRPEVTAGARPQSRERTSARSYESGKRADEAVDLEIT